MNGGGRNRVSERGFASKQGPIACRAIGKPNRFGVGMFGPCRCLFPHHIRRVDVFDSLGDVLTAVPMPLSSSYQTGFDMNW